ncbi:glycoside hydrolase family 18 protein [Lactarius hengduanensis]|nr:glycoside hydrolase family 18 protein [Lactarius hengduanensis]
MLLLIRAFVALSALLAFGFSAEVLGRPSNYRGAFDKSATNANVKSNVIQKRVTGKVQAAYFTNWGIYGANFQPTDIIPSDLTHLLYAFADVTPSTGSIFLTDSYADEQKHFPGDSWSEPGVNLYGCLKQVCLLLRPRGLIGPSRNLKVLLSIGGWTYSQSGHFSFVTNPSLRATFVSSAIQLIKDYGFDGIDIDFEYPSSTAQGQGFADLLTELRTAMNALANSNGDTVPYQLTAAVAAGAANYASLVVPQMNSALTYWNLMAYDYAGSWLTWADNQANLYGGARTNVSTDAAVQWYLSKGATASKINMGIPLYGRAFDNTDGLGMPYSGIGPGTIEAGVYSYSALPLSGAQVFENTTDVTSYSYNPTSRELVSYDTPHIATLKAQYVQTKGLAGSMFWEVYLPDLLSIPESHTVERAPHISLTAPDLRRGSYPTSKWDNIRSNMGQGTPSGTTSAPAPTSSTSSAPVPTSTTGSGACAGVAAWSSQVRHQLFPCHRMADIFRQIAYNGGQQATYSKRITCWWTQADTPGGAAGVWTDNGAC